MVELGREKNISIHFHVELGFFLDKGCVNSGSTENSVSTHTLKSVACTPKRPWGDKTPRQQVKDLHPESIAVSR